MLCSEKSSLLRRLAARLSTHVLGGSALALLLMVGTPVSAVHDSGVFELDGNAAAPGSVDDANTIFGGPGLSLDHSFLSDTTVPDTSFHGLGNRDPEPIEDWHCTTTTPSQAINDLRHAYVAAYRVNDDLHLFFGGERGGNSGGSAFGLWLFQQPVQCNPATGDFTGHKTDGDLFIVGDFHVTVANFTIEVYKWRDPNGIPESGDESLVLLESGIECTGTDPHSASELVCGVRNAGNIAVDWDAAQLPQKRYIEGGLNLSALFEEHSFGPACYTTFMAETREGTGLPHRPFDYVIGDISTCASVTVNTTTDPSADTQQFNFAVAGGPDSINDTFQLADATTPHITMDMKPGSYTVTETVPSVWSLTGATCVGGPFGGGGAYANGSAMTLNFGDHVTCTFNNFKTRGTLTVDKITAPVGDPQLFNFTVAGPVNDSFQLAGATAPHSTTGLLPGAYSITEDAVAGWDSGGITCTGGPFGAGGAYVNGGTINVDWGQVISCAFNNTKRGSITVDKVTAPIGDAQSFEFILNGGPDSIHDVFPLTDAAAPHTTANLRPGTYTLTETTPAGWDFAGATCVGGPFGAGGSLANGGNISLTPGSHITCTVTDVRRSRITVDKVTTPGGDPRIFKFVISGKPNVGKLVRFPFELTDTAAPFSVELKPGSYKIVERVAPGWKLTGATCVGGPFGGGNPYIKGTKFTLNPTEQVTCTFSNMKK
jgi:hypothetical protein